ncbi:hypothetical protein HY251_12500, partial [bacterium]|nr:hypothetical protein [bacterium]
DERSDVYSLGATFYTLLTGKAPYEGASAIQIMFAQCSNPVPDARAVSPEVPERCAALVLRAMAKEPHDRHPSAAALLADLESLVSRRLPAQPPRSPGASEARREIAWIAAALLAGALITGGALGAVMPQDAKPVARAPAKPAPAPVKPAPQPPAPARVAPTTPPRVEPPARPDPPSSPPSEPPPEPAPAPPPPGPVGSEIACDACDSVHRHASLTGDGRIGSMVVSPAGRRVAVSIEDGERGVMLHRGDRGPPRIARWAGLPVRSLAFSPDGDAIAATLSSEGEESLRLWSIDDDRETAVSLDGEATSVAFAADGRTVAVAIAGAEPRALVRAFPRGDLVRTLRGPKKRIASVACSSDGKRVATGGEDGVFVWDASGEKTLGPVGERIACVAFSPDARHLAAGSGPGFLLVDLETGKPISERAASARVLSLAFSRDGRWLALGSESGEIAAFDTAAKTIAHRLGVRGASVRALAFTPDGKLASASDETVRMWEVAR